MNFCSECRYRDYHNCRNPEIVAAMPFLVAHATNGACRQADVRLKVRKECPGFERKLFWRCVDFLRNRRFVGYTPKQLDPKATA